jgi:hypothetical protein
MAAKKAPEFLPSRAIMRMSTMQTMPPATLIEAIRATLSENSQSPLAAYALIVGAGFSHGVVPLTRELLHERIGDFYYPRGSEEGSGEERSSKEKQRLSRAYWKEFNAATVAAGEPFIELDRKGLPVNPSVAYQQLFTCRTTNTLFDSAPKIRASPYLANLRKHRDRPRPQAKVMAGQQFVKEFMQNELDRGGYLSEAGPAGKSWLTTGRSELNAAHFFLASLLELQQSGELRNLRPFCRTIFTTNFDTLLQSALQLVNLMYCVTDRPERGIEVMDFLEHDRALHLVYTHGSILRHNAASTTDELLTLTKKNACAISQYMGRRDVLVFGYGGWEDTLMSALADGYRTGRRIYWCNVYPEHEVEDRLAPAVRDLFRLYENKAFYVPLGRGGSDTFMAHLYGALAPDGPIPRLLRDPLGVFVDRLRHLKVDNVIFVEAEMTPAVRKLPLPGLERPGMAMLRSMLGVLGAAQRCFGSDAGPGPHEKALLAGQEQSMLERGFALALSGQHEKAIQLWSRIVESTTAVVESTTAGFESWMASYCGAEAANYIGVVHCRTGCPDLAVPAHTRAQELAYGAPYLEVKSLTHLGVALNHLGRTELAIENLSRAVAIWEDHPSAVDDKIAGRALVYRGLLREWVGDRSIAQEDFARARSMRQLSDECRQLLGLSATQ